MKNLSNMLREAQKLQQRMAEMQERLAQMRIEGAAGGGLVRITLDGKGGLIAVKIDRSLVDPQEVEVLEDLIVAAHADARNRLEAALQEEMGRLTGGLPLPPGFKLPF
jgi:DNA-binding YbaB/EbfC family protein